MSSQDHSIDDFTREELESAKADLVKHMTEFWEDSNVGYIIRERAIEAFKRKRKLKNDVDPAVVAITADLANDSEISRAIEMNHEMHMKSCS